MKDEIKEINIPENVLNALGDLTNGALNYYKATESVKVRHNTILDYITNLQEENKMLKEDKKKAIEYINSHQLFKYIYDEEELVEIIHDKEAKKDLLNILQGDDKDEN